MLFCDNIRYVLMTRKFACVNLNVFAVDWKNITVDDAWTTSLVIFSLEADEEYCVKIKSVSFIGHSYFTAPLKRRVLRTGNEVSVCFVLLLFSIFFNQSIHPESLQVMSFDQDSFQSLCPS